MNGAYLFYAGVGMVAIALIIAPTIYYLECRKIDAKYKKLREECEARHQAEMKRINKL